MATTNTMNEIDDPAVLQAYQDALEDCHTRFLLNLPEEELATADRILFQIEQAWWFYEDFIADADNSGALPRFKRLKPFAVEMFQFSPLFEVNRFQSMWDAFSKYKQKISTYGCILLNLDCTKILLCQDYNSKSWTFPAGKINQGEDGIDAAARETWEETGFDVNANYGLTQQMAPDAITWQKPLQEKDAVNYTEDNGKHRTYFICHGVPEDFPFEPVVRKEVAAVEWHPLNLIPKRNFAVLPVLPKVKRWVKRNTGSKTPKKGRERDKSNPKQGGRTGTPSKNNKGREGSNSTPLKSNKTPNRKDKEKDSNSNKKTPNRDRKKQGSRPKSRGKVVQVLEDDPLLETGLAAVGAENRWSEEAMFEANEKLMGRKVEYDGNPHVFSEQGFQGKDPHHFHVVGGTFLNSDTNVLAPPPPTSRLQHLFHTKNQDAAVDGTNPDSNNAGVGASEFLTPFFSDDGATPWGEVVQEVKEAVASPQRHLMLTDNSKGVAKNNDTTKSNQKKTSKSKQEEPTRSILAVADNDADLVFMTDEEITARSQTIKLAEWKASKDEGSRQYQQDLQDIQQWVDTLPQAQPTKHFGQFKFNVDALMEAFYQNY